MHIVETAPERVGIGLRHGGESHKDTLTGLPNEAALRLVGPRIIDQAVSKRQTGCVVIVDLNGLQAINDALDSRTGDRILRSLAGKLEELAGPGGLAARIGDDEFVLILRGKERREVADLMSSLHRRVSSLWPSSVHFESKGVSVGVAWFPEEGRSLEMLMVQADFRMHIDKRNKKTEHILELEAMGSERLVGPG